MIRSGGRLFALFASLGLLAAGIAAAADKPAAKSAASMSAEKPAASMSAGNSSQGDVAVFAGGCFWCMETDFEERPGIRSVISGYTGGNEPNPTYEQVSSHMTGHFESVEIRFDPKVISYEQLLTLFWHSIDPTQGDGQFCDIGHQYQSAIFVRGAEQRAAAEKSKKELAASGILKKPIVTEILDAKKFWPAEEYHQDFWKKSPVRYRTYRFGCGRDQRTAQLWGKDAVKPLVH